MADFTIHSPDSAPEASRPILEQTQKNYGFVPNLMGVLAEAPAAARAYATISGIFDDTNLSPTERQVVLLTTSRYNGCEYCMAAHTTISQMQGIESSVIDAIRNDKPIDDQKLEALRQFTHRVVDQRGELDSHDIAALIGAGYSRQTVLEVIVGVAMKTISNYANHVADTELDGVFAAQRWSGGGEQAA